MPAFKLTQDAVSRLSAKFEEFRRERETVQNLLEDYIADYGRFEGTALARQEYLEEKYSSRVPSLSHLTWSEDGEIYWNVPDIAIVLGRQRPSITRAFARMEQEDGWCARLLALRREAKAENGLPVYVYRRDIFNLLIDRYEDRSTCALEMLKLVSDSLPDDDGMTFDFFRFRRGEGVFVRGKASQRESWRQLEQALRAAQAPRPGQEDETDDDAPPLFSEVKPSDSSQNRDGMFPFTVEAKFPVSKDEDSSGRKAK